MAFTGSCLCGAIQYQFSGFGDHIAHCHCSICRKFHGAAFSTFVPVAMNDLHWLKGEQQLTVYIAENGSKRQFCKTCGSSLTFQSANSEDTLEIALATLDSSSASEEKYPQPDAHVHVSSKVEWFAINDALPQYRNDRE